MCELMGISFDRDVNINLSFRGFIHRGDENYDGWGLAFYPEGGSAAQVFKEPIRASSSPMAELLREYSKVRSSIYISHVRRATSEVCFANTHPFLRELNGREYIFAHNGYLTGGYRTNLYVEKYKPVGSTDSEFAFCYLLDMIEKQIENWNSSSFVILEEAMRKINAYGRFNCLLSDGEYLFCYRDISGYKGLCYTQRKAPLTITKLMDEDLEIDFNTEKESNETGYVIATRKLTNECWREFERGQLTVFRKGTMIFPCIAINNDEIFMHALRYIRTNPTRTSIFAIANAISGKISNMPSLIEKLQNKGYIKQDSRDTEGPYSPGSSYYTVPEKRSEIDKLLNDDMSYYLLSNDDINIIDANVYDKIAACMRCLQVYKNEATFCRKCLHKLEMIDTRMLNILFILNKKGYLTKFCCSGHKNNQYRLYLILEGTIDKCLYPVGFTTLQTGSDTEIRSLPYHAASKNKKDRVIGECDLEQLAKQNVINLLAWAESLPNRY